MTQLAAGGIGTVTLHHPMLATPPASPKPSLVPRRRLDREGLRAGLARLQLQMATLETEMVAACERAAERGASRGVRIDDRATWDRATWQRYLDAGAKLEPDYGPRLRRLYQDIDHLTRLIGMPLAA